jgi:uncharacterized membrane protein
LMMILMQLVEALPGLRYGHQPQRLHSQAALHTNIRRKLMMMMMMMTMRMMMMMRMMMIVVVVMMMMVMTLVQLVEPLPGLRHRHQPQRLHVQPALHGR